MTEGDPTDVRALQREHGATSVEYAIMASLVAVVIIASVLWLGEATASQLCSPIDGLRAAGQTVEGCD